METLKLLQERRIRTHIVRIHLVIGIIINWRLSQPEISIDLFGGLARVEADFRLSETR